MAKKVKWAERAQKKSKVRQEKFEAEKKEAPEKVTISEDNPYKKGSRKAEIYEVFKRDGIEAATDHAGELGIKSGTVKSWSGAWSKGETKPKAKAPGDKPAKSATVQDKGFHPEFKYSSRERADKAHEALCERAGLRSHAFHVIEDDGRFAVCPSHLHPNGPPPSFKPGDIVYDIMILNSKAKVIESGPEQTVVRYSQDRPSRPREQCVINRFLVKLPERQAKPDDKASNKIKKGFDLIPNIKKVREKL